MSKNLFVVLLTGLTIAFNAMALEMGPVKVKNKLGKDLKVTVYNEYSNKKETATILKGGSLAFERTGFEMNFLYNGLNYQIKDEVGLFTVKVTDEKGKRISAAGNLNGTGIHQTKNIILNRGLAGQANIDKE